MAEAKTTRVTAFFMFLLLLILKNRRFYQNVIAYNVIFNLKVLTHQIFAVLRISETESMD